MKYLIFFLGILGSFLLLGMTLPRHGVKGRILAAAEAMRQKRPKRAETAKEYVARIDGVARESLMRRSQREAQQVFEQTGQQRQYQRTLRLAQLMAALGAAGGLLLFQTPLLAVVLAVGCYYLPLWLTQFSLYRYNRFLSEELETSLSLITSSYTRNNDILAAVEENLAYIQDPVKTVFTAFCNNLKYVDANAPAQLQRLRTALDNKIFRQWCDCLIMCQDDHTLRATLLPIVGKFSDQKAQQQENETKMMLPLRNAIGMICLVLSIIPLLRVFNATWYQNLVATWLGQVSLVVTVVVTLATINRAIKLSKPIEYDV